MLNNKQSTQKSGYGRTLIWLVTAKIVIIIIAVVVILVMKGLL